MPKLPVISGEDIVKILVKQKGYRVRAMRGSHINLVHDSLPPITVPVHKELRTGTLKHILKITGIKIE